MRDRLSITSGNMVTRTDSCILHRKSIDYASNQQALSSTDPKKETSAIQNGPQTRQEANATPSSIRYRGKPNTKPNNAPNAKNTAHFTQCSYRTRHSSHTRNAIHHMRYLNVSQIILNRKIHGCPVARCAIFRVVPPPFLVIPWCSVGVCFTKSSINTSLAVEPYPFPRHAIPLESGGQFSESRQRPVGGLIN